MSLPLSGGARDKLQRLEERARGENLPAALRIQKGPKVPMRATEEEGREGRKDEDGKGSKGGDREFATTVTNLQLLSKVAN